MKKIIISTILFSLTFTTSSAHGEVMQGGGYTVNGSVDVIVNQGTGGSYSVKPNGDSISSNSTGGNYNLYPTPYTNPPSTTTGYVIAAVVGSMRYGDESGNNYSATSSTNTNSSNTDDTDDAENPTTNSNTGNNPSNNGVGNGNTNSNSTDGGENPFENGSTEEGYYEPENKVKFGKKNSIFDEKEIFEEIKNYPIKMFLAWIILIIIFIYIMRRWWQKIQN